MHVSNSSDITNFGAFILNLKLWSDKVSHVRGNCFYNFSQIIYVESMLESYIYNLILGMILIFEIEGENLFYNTYKISSKEGNFYTSGYSKRRGNWKLRSLKSIFRGDGNPFLSWILNLLKQNAVPSIRTDIIKSTLVFLLLFSVPTTS